MEGLVVVEAKREPKRIYVRNVVKKAKNEIKKIKRVLNEEWPETVTCKVCYKRIPIGEAILRLGITGPRGDYYMCKAHDE